MNYVVKIWKAGVSVRHWFETLSEAEEWANIGFRAVTNDDKERGVIYSIEEDRDDATENEKP